MKLSELTTFDLKNSGELDLFRGEFEARNLPNSLTCSILEEINKGTGSPHPAKHMAQNAAAPSNGVKTKTAPAAQTKTAPTAQTSQTAPLLNAPSIKVDPPKEEVKKPERTLDEALADIRYRAELADKLEDLLETKARLEQFRLGTVGLRDRITISDGQREFTTSNSAVMDKVYKTICEAVDEKVSELGKMLTA